MATRTQKLIQQIDTLTTDNYHLRHANAEQAAYITQLKEQVNSLQKDIDGMVQMHKQQVEKINPTIDGVTLKEWQDWAMKNPVNPTEEFNRLDEYLRSQKDEFDELDARLAKLEAKLASAGTVNKTSPEGESKRTEYLNWLRDRITKQRETFWPDENTWNSELDHTLSHCLSLIDRVKETGGVK